MIRPPNDELEMIISIALKTAPAYALRNVMTPTRGLDRRIAVQTITQRVIAALGSYEITREPNDLECGDRTMPLFPEIVEK